MLSPELELADLDARHWKTWWSLVLPPRVRERPPWALAIVDRDRVIKLAIAGRGAIEIPEALPPVAAIARWPARLGVAAAIAIDRAVIGELSAEIEAALRFEMDLVEQGLIALRALKRRAGRGVWTEPAVLDLLPAPAYDGVQRTFDLLIPDRTALAAYVIDDDRRRIAASIIAVKQRGDVTRAATHRAIAERVPEAAFAGDWQRGYKRALAAIEDRFARPSLAVFLERATLMRIVTGPGDQLARELDARRVVLDPAPAWLLGLLGGATVATIAGRAASALASMLPQPARERAAALARSARDVMMESGAHPFAMLGFDPIELWNRVRAFYRA